jgi:hypothetical protein
MTDDIWVVTRWYDGEIAENSYHRTEAGARAGIAGYCRETWEDEEVEGDPPEDDEALVKQYCACVDLEKFEIERHPLGA